jgi:hypothetical protein
MGYNEDLINVRKRVLDLLERGAVTPTNKDFFESTLIQIMNDAERNRQTCMTSAENLKRQVNVLEGQASGFASVSSLILGVLNGFVTIHDKNEQEIKELNKVKEQDTQEEESKKSKPRKK